jgi:hypothetical protein
VFGVRLNLFYSTDQDVLAADLRRHGFDFVNEQIIAVHSDTAQLCHCIVFCYF